ncbi:MAG: PHP domain-containing protein, partial [Syntrophales bacterium]
MPDFYDYTGIIHSHSAYSFDGRAPVGEILEAARINGIDFVMLTDHSNLRAKEEGFEGWHGDTLLIVGQEIAPRFNHYLAFQINTPVVIAEDEPDIDPQTYVDEVLAKGGMGFIAHPDHEGTKLFHVKHYPWLDWTVTGYTGMGIWDFMTDWQNTLRGYPRSILSFLFPAFFLTGPRKVTLERWDRLNSNAKVVGIGELDNHDTSKRELGFNLSVFPFAKAFKFMRTHV